MSNPLPPPGSPQLQESASQPPAVHRLTLTTKYLGGHPRNPNAKRSVLLTMDSKGVKAKHAFSTVLAFPWAEVTAISAEGSDAIQRRVTATRLVAIGLFAFAAQKKTKQAWLTISTADGDAILEVKGKDVHELQARVNPFLSLISQAHE